MNTKTISVENLGPIAAMEFAIDSPGVTVLVAPNGSGKTILLEFEGKESADAGNRLSDVRFFDRR